MRSLNGSILQQMRPNYDQASHNRRGPVTYTVNTGSCQQTKVKQPPKLKLTAAALFSLCGIWKYTIPFFFSFNLRLLLMFLVSDSLSVYELESWYIYCLPFHLAYAIHTWIHQSKIPPQMGLCLVFALNQTAKFCCWAAISHPNVQLALEIQK